MSAYPIDVKGELFSAISKLRGFRKLPFAQQVDESLALLANVLGFDIAILGKIEGENWQASAIHGTSSLSIGASFPLSELPCYAAANSSNACYQEKVKSPDAAFNYAVYLGRALIVDKSLYGTLHLGRKTALPRPLLAEEEEFFLIVADMLSEALEREQAAEREISLMRNNEALSAAQEAIHLGYWYWDIKTNKTEWSEELFRVYGLEPYSVETNYQEWLNVIAPEDKERANQVVWDASQRGGSFEMDWDTLHVNTGARRHLTSVGDCIRDAEGNVVAMFGTAQDITEKKRAQDIIRKSEEALTAAQAVAKLGHWRWDIAKNHVEWSDEYYRLHGYEAKSVEPSYELWRKTIAPEDLERMESTVKSAIENKSDYDVEYEIVLPNGERRSQYSLTRVELDEKGNVAYLFGIGQDITERKAMENSLRDRTRDLELAMEVSKQISQILTTEELLAHLVSLLQKSFNFYHVSAFIYDSEEDSLVLQDASGLIGKRMKADGKQFSLSSNEKGLVLQAARTRQAVLENDVEKSTHHLPNLYLPLTRSELAMPMMVGSRLIGVLDLQSSQINHFGENELRVLSSLAEQLAIAIENAHLYSQQAKVTQKLIQLDKLKSQFLANMSHELRTPLNAILNFSSFVAKGVYGEVNAEQEENLNKVISSATHLLALINDILDLSKIEAGMMNLFIEDANMNTLFQSVINTASGLARPQGVNFVTEIAPNLPTMKLDKRRIRQIFLNLISNAFKFTQSGEIRMNVVCEDNMLMCSVSDTGTGIHPSELDLIFEPFKQTDVGVSKGGTGLGLPISRYFAEAHGGKLWVESEWGKGTTFYVSLPLQVDVIHEEN